MHKFRSYPGQPRCQVDIWPNGSIENICMLPAEHPTHMEVKDAIN